MTLTPRQSQVLAYLRDYRREHGYAPTHEEIGIRLGATKVTAHEHLNALEAKGCIRRNKHKCRGIEVTRRGLLALAVASPCPKEAAIREVLAALKLHGQQASMLWVEHRLLAAIGGKP